MGIDKTGTLDGLPEEARNAMMQMFADSWVAHVPIWNGKPTNYNPGGREFKRRDLELMAQQEAFDQAGISGFPVADTADELLVRAKDVAELGRRLR